MLVLLSSVCGSICGAISWLAAEGEAHVLVVTGAVVFCFNLKKGIGTNICLQNIMVSICKLLYP